MMVLEVRNTSGTPVPLANAGGISLGTVHELLFPADRCVWEVDYDAANNQYEIVAAYFYGNATGAGTAGAPATLHGADRIVRLGYLGKSGRFVPITENR